MAGTAEGGAVAHRVGVSVFLATKVQCAGEVAKAALSLSGCTSGNFARTGGKTENTPAAALSALA